MRMVMTTTRNIDENQQMRKYPTASILPCRSQILTAAARFIFLMMMKIMMMMMMMMMMRRRRRRRRRSRSRILVIMRTLIFLVIHMTLLMKETVMVMMTINVFDKSIVMLLAPHCHHHQKDFHTIGCYPTATVSAE